MSKAHKTHTYTLTCVYVYYVNYKTTYTYTSVYYTLVDSLESYRFSQYITLYTQHLRYLNIEYSHTKPTHAPQDRHYLSSSEYSGSPLSEMPSRPAPASVSPFVRHAPLGFALAEHAIRLALRTVWLCHLVLDLLICRNFFSAVPIAFGISRVFVRLLATCFELFLNCKLSVSLNSTRLHSMISSDPGARRNQPSSDSPSLSCAAASPYRWSGRS